MRRIVLAALMMLAGLSLRPVQAEVSALSQEIGRAGLAATEARLAALAEPAPDELFALAGLRFLGGIERALQLRWETGVSADWSELPILRLPIPDNPGARAFRGDDLVLLLTGVDDAMARSRAALEVLGTRDFALELSLGDLWFDINASGARDPGEGVADVAGTMLGGGGVMGGGPKGGPEGGPLVRFDTADAAWLSAYTHLLQGFASGVRAYAPAAAVDRVLGDSAAMHALWGTTPPDNAWDMLFGREVDRAAILLTALAQTPDAGLTRAAHGHLLAMIADNRRFWALVAAETDDQREWVPGDRQTSALGLPMQPGTGAHWLAVLAEAEALLTGAVLAPHWRYGAEAGIDVKALFEDPPAVDLVRMIQGGAFLPYARKGPLISLQAWEEFARLVQGETLLYAVFLN